VRKGLWLSSIAKEAVFLGNNYGEAAAIDVGADIILIDDPLKPEEALSDAQRQAANDWYDHTLYSRRNDKCRSAIVMIIPRSGCSIVWADFPERALRRH
jgi:hypothetical protein